MQPIQRPDNFAFSDVHVTRRRTAPRRSADTSSAPRPNSTKASLRARSARASATARGAACWLARLGRGVSAERRAVSVAVVRRGGVGARRPGDASRRARGRRLDAGPFHPWPPTANNGVPANLVA